MTRLKARRSASAKARRSRASHARLPALPSRQRLSSRGSSPVALPARISRRTASTARRTDLTASGRESRLIPSSTTGRSKSASTEGRRRKASLTSSSVRGFGPVDGSVSSNSLPPLSIGERDARSALQLKKPLDSKDEKERGEDDEECAEPPDDPRVHPRGDHAPAAAERKGDGRKPNEIRED